MTMQGFRDSNGQPAIIEDRRYTPVQGVERTYQLLCAYIEVMEYAPTLDELAALAGVAKSTVKYHLDALQETGRISVEPAVARGIVVIE